MTFLGFIAVLAVLEIIWFFTTWYRYSKGRLGRYF
jgi:hypothetical protein